MVHIRADVRCCAPQTQLSLFGALQMASFLFLVAGVAVGFAAGWLLRAQRSPQPAADETPAPTTAAHANPAEDEPKATTATEPVAATEPTTATEPAASADADARAPLVDADSKPALDDAPLVDADSKPALDDTPLVNADSKPTVDDTSLVDADSKAAAEVEPVVPATAQ